MQTNNAVCRAFGISTDPAGLKSLMGRVLDPLPLMYKDINGHSAVVNPDGYKGHWNMRLRGNELRMAQVRARHPRPPQLRVVSPAHLRCISTAASPPLHLHRTCSHAR